MLRRIHTPILRPGLLPLPPDQAHHLQHVLRLQSGDTVELFDDLGATALATLVPDGPTLAASVQTIASPRPTLQLTIAAAIPKGDRADWMVEKLSELGVHRLIPLATERSVVLPQGQNKRDRWLRLAVESAKQSRRPGLMKIDELTPLPLAIQHAPTARYLALSPAAQPLSALLTPAPLTLFIGPEGGWTDDETHLFAAASIPPAHLTDTVLRIETAAIAAAAIVASHHAATSYNQSL